MASTPALLRTLFMPKTIVADMVRPDQVPIYKPNSYRNNAIKIRGASSSSEEPPITKGGGQRINSTDTAASENKEYSGSSITDQKGAKKNDEKVPDTTSENTPEATDKK